ncbi:hypothetical protein [uncultured Lacinutrix sp.]|uniref:hypothetical protein n=1 Tax=uncultured Lacinutrix sp. TaxID=574032 RepID=UPI0026060907|nr:hypothetical protein [uncultured Lacinutrix sp.]
MFRKQFLLTQEPFQLIEGFIAESIGNFNLQYHKDCVFTKVVNNNLELILLGELYSYKTPALSNKQILESLSNLKELNVFLDEISNFYGQFVVLYKTEKDFVLFNDACAQAEIYYSNDFLSFGSQVKLLQEKIELIPYKNTQAKAYYKSKEFNELRLFIQDTTDVSNVKHLMPNHYVGIYDKKVVRFYPNAKREEKSIEETAIIVANMLKGYIKAIALRHKICLPITAGYDSRVLFLASLDLDCDYFVTKFKNMPENHNDLVISKQLAKLYNKPFNIIDDIEMEPKDFETSYAASLDNPLFLSPDAVGDKVIINGNISEIGRNGYYYCANPTAKNLNNINFFKPHKFIREEYNKWLSNNKSILKKTKYHILDIFLWEQFMGIVHAKAKSQNKQLGVSVVSPYNSRVLLDTMLRVDRDNRDRMDNALYNKMIAYLSNNNQEVINLPINPSKEKSRYLIFKRLGLHKAYSTLKVKLKSL